MSNDDDIDDQFDLEPESDSEVEIRQSAGLERLDGRDELSSLLKARRSHASTATHRLGRDGIIEDQSVLTNHRPYGHARCSRRSFSAGSSLLEVADDELVRSRCDRERRLDRRMGKSIPHWDRHPSASTADAHLNRNNQADNQPLRSGDNTRKVKNCHRRSLSMGYDCGNETNAANKRTRCCPDDRPEGRFGRSDLFEDRHSHASTAVRRGKEGYSEVRRIDHSVNMPQFDGLGDEELFLQRFHTLAQYYEWREEDKLFRMKQCIRGDAPSDSAAP